MLLGRVGGRERAVVEAAGREWSSETFSFMEVEVMAGRDLYSFLNLLLRRACVLLSKKKKEKVYENNKTKREKKKNTLTGMKTN